MDLMEFVGKRHVNVSKLSQEIGYSREHIQRVLAGHIKLSKKLAIALENVSEGKLIAQELLGKNKEARSD